MDTTNSKYDVLAKGLTAGGDTIRAIRMDGGCRIVVDGKIVAKPKTTDAAMREFLRLTEIVLYQNVIA